MLNPIARVAQQYKLEKTKEENITKRRIFDLTEKLAYAVARYSKESQVNILKALAVKEGELGSFIANRVAKLLRINLFEKTADVTVTIPEEIEKFFRGIKKIIKVAQDDDEGHDRPVKTMESPELRKIVSKSIEASLDPLIVVAKLKEIAKADSSFAALFDQYPKRTFNSAMMLLQTYPWLIDRPALLASLVKRMTSHSGLEPSELIAIGHKSLKTDPFIESIVKSAEDPNGNPSTDRKLKVEVKKTEMPDWLKPILSHGAEVSPWLLSGLAGAFTNPFTATALGALSYELNKYYGPEKKDRWVWPQLANLLPIWYGALSLRNLITPISKYILPEKLHRLLAATPESIPYDVSLSGLNLEKLTPEWQKPPDSVPSWFRRKVLWPSDIEPALQVLKNKNFLEMDFPEKPATSAPGHQWLFGTVAETLRNYKNAFRGAIDEFSDGYKQNLSQLSQFIGNTPNDIPLRLKTSMYGVLQDLTRSTAFSSKPTTEGMIYRVYRDTFDGVAAEKQGIRVQNLRPQTIKGSVSNLIIEIPTNKPDTIEFKLQLRGDNIPSVSEVLHREAQLFKGDVFENYGQIKREHPMLDALRGDIRTFERTLRLVDMNNEPLRQGPELEAAREFLNNIRQHALGDSVRVSLDRFRVLGALEHHYGSGVLRSALDRGTLSVGTLIHPKRLMVSHHPTYARARAAKSGFLPLIIAAGAGLIIPGLVSSWEENKNRPLPREEGTPGIDSASKVPTSPLVKPDSGTGSQPVKYDPASRVPTSPLAPR
jgi:hypothetical protein